MNKNRQLIIADAHVHIHDCFNIQKFFDSAWSNFLSVSKKLNSSDSFIGILFLTECYGVDWFSRFSKSAKEQNHNTSSKLNFQQTKEDCSLKVVIGDGKELILIAGRQVVSEENLEILALGIKKDFGEGKSITDIIAETFLQGGIPVVPWGVGKWMGKRGEIVKDMLLNKGSHTFLLGDNRNRPTFWPRPSLFAIAENRGAAILPGSDALPIPSENQISGSFGFYLPQKLNLSKPFEEVSQVILDPKVTKYPFGMLENPLRFFKNQFLLRFQN